MLSDMETMTSYELLQQLIDTDTDDCIIWPKSMSGVGYGSVWHEGKAHNTHRMALELAEGAPPHPSMQACHGECHNRACVNPRHLSWQTNSRNQADRKRDGTSGALLTFEQAEEIRLKHVTGEYTMRALGREYGVGHASIRKIIEHITYIY